MTAESLLIQISLFDGVSFRESCWLSC